MALAQRLNERAAAAAPLFFLTDPERTPDPIALVRRLPRGAGVIYRHFGASDRGRTAARLARACMARGLLFLIAADPVLATSVGADGVHWPELRLPDARDPRLRLETASAHGAEAAVRAERFGASACILGPVFPTRSAAGKPPLGLFRASQIARRLSIPVIALGGVTGETAQRLAGRGFSGLAAIDALLS
jgi:thiamine-phosphate pyrophosphorylase